ncbi:MAG TPA: hypothetical protein EYP14_14495 [Planctomycetaceae bacterium]|nr:hypothetical protein [Planctomycetaceae bacterium]
MRTASRLAGGLAVAILAASGTCGPDRTWVTAYANDAPCYIASARVIREGGYEVDESMNTYDKPTRLSVAAEELIINTACELLGEVK